jgi:TRAP-type mannitol/chloroaromatic compound transport system substrate-binding protein
MVNRREFAAGTAGLVAAAGAGLAAPAIAQAPTFRLRMATAVPENSFFHNAFMKPYADMVATLTDGQVQIQVFGAGTLVPPLRVHQAVQEGTIDLGHTSPAYLVNLDPVNALISGHPGGMSPETMLHWLYGMDGRKLWTDFRRETMQLHPVIAGIGTTEIFAHSNRRIRTREDLVGLKHRTSGGWATILRERFQGVPTVVPAGDIFTLLERRGIDSIEWATPGSNLPEGFHRITRYIIVPGVHANSFPWEVVMQSARWDAMPERLRARMELAGRLVTFDSYITFGIADLAAMEQFRASTTNEIIELDPALVTDIKAAGRDWAREQAVAQTAKGNPWMARVFESYDGFQQRWARNASYRADDRG